MNPKNILKRSIILVFMSAAISGHLMAQSVAVEDIDGNLYQTTTIGTQTWFSGNLRTSRLNSGEAIVLADSKFKWATLSNIPGYCWYNFEELNYGKIYGGLYNFYAIRTGKLCPSGWRVPTEEDWTRLAEFLGGAKSAAGKLKAAGTQYWRNQKQDSDNQSGFSALPGGCLLTGYGFQRIESRGYWWAATVKKPGWCMYYSMDASNNKLTQSSYYPHSGFSVRCIKEQPGP